MKKTETPEIPANETPEKKAEAKYFKEQIVSSKYYQHQRDLLNVLLEDEKAYSHADVEKIIEKFLKGKVK